MPWQAYHSNLLAAPSYVFCSRKWSVARHERISRLNCGDITYAMTQTAPMVLEMGFAMTIALRV